MSRRAGWVALLALSAVATGCGARASFGDGSFGEIEDAFKQGGLQICTHHKEDDGLANQAVQSRTYGLALDCDTDDRAQVTVDEFDDVDDRDAAVRGFEVSVRPRGSGAAWTYGRTSIFVFGTSDDPVFDQVATTLDDDLGAAR